MKARIHARVPSHARGSCKSERGFGWDIQLANLSRGGCRIDDPRRRMVLGSRVKLFIVGTGPHVAEVAWRQGDRVGIEFLRALPERVFHHLSREEWDAAFLAHSEHLNPIHVRRAI